MIKKIIVIIITTFTLVSNLHAGSDGELILKKNEPSEIKDCSETFNKASFAINQGLDKVIFKPVASVYRLMPSPVKTGVSNSCLLYTSPSPRDRVRSRMPSSA